MKSKPLNIINKNSSLFLATFSQYEKRKRLPTNGMIDQLLYFFLPKVKTFTLVDEPHPISDTVNPIIEVFRNGKLRKRFSIHPFFYLPIYLVCKMPSKKTTRISYKLRDLFAVLATGLLQKEKYDLFIGLESINTLAGIILKKLGKVNMVVYYVSDYSPIWFGKTLFNEVYLRLDRFCVRHADFTWDVSPLMKQGRLSAGLSIQDTTRILHVPNGLFPSQIKMVPVSQRQKDTVVYMGILDKEMGIDLTIEAFKLVRLKKPQATLHVIGGTKKAIGRLKPLVDKLGINNSVIFHGFLAPDKKMADIIKYCCIGVAPYLRDKTSRRKYGDPGKIRQYLGCGLPIVSTNLLWHAKYTVAMGAGVGTKDTPRDLADGILKLLENEVFYKKCSENAWKLGRNNTWDNTYSSALHSMRDLIHKKEKK